MAHATVQSPEVLRRKLDSNAGASAVRMANGQTVEESLGGEVVRVDGIAESLTKSIARVKPQRHVPPAALGYIPPFSIFSNVDGTITTDFDITEYRYKGNGAYCWVDPSKPNNTGDGLTPATAKRDLAPLLTNNTTYETIYIVPGALFDRDAIKGWGGALTVSKNIICPGGRAKISRRYSPASWVNEGAGVFSCAVAGVRICFDAQVLDDYGLYSLIDRVDTLGDLAGVESGWYSDGATLYIKRVDQQQPTVVTTAIFLNEGTGNGSGIVRGDVHVYCENIDFEGGYAAMSCRTTAADQNQKYFGKNCRYGYSFSEDGFSCFGAKLVMHQDSVAMRNVKDGFNYHENESYPSEFGYFVEVNCAAYRNGITQLEVYENNRNASTSHDNYVGVRVNFAGYETYGPIIADVDGAKTWNIGVSAYSSQGQATDQQCNFFVGGDGALMWLDRCWGHSSPEALVVGAGSTLYFRDSYLEGSPTIIGDLEEY